MLYWRSTAIWNVDAWKQQKSVSHLQVGASDMYRQVSNISRALVGNSIVGHSDVVGAAPTGDAPTTSE